MDINQYLQTLIEKAIAFIPNLIVAIIAFVISLLLSGIAAQWVKKHTEKTIKDFETRQLLSRLARWSIIVSGTLVALDQVNFDVTGFLAGLGVAGLTVGFALQDIARNFVAGILLLIRQPFNIGDAVAVSGYTGTVMDITTRDTVIKTWDGEMVIISNTDVFNNPIINYTLLPLCRRTVRIGLGYGEDVEKAKEIFIAAIQDIEGVLEDPAPTLLAEELGDSAMIIAARFWVNQNTDDVFAIHSNVIIALNKAAEKEGINLPYPIQTVRLEKVAQTAPTS